MITERRIAELERRLETLDRFVQSGPGSTTAFGATGTRVAQPGFPAKLTSSYSATTGYDWEMRYVPTAAPIADLATPYAGNKAWEVGGRTDLVSGQKVWLEPDREGRGWVFAAAAAGSLTVEEDDAAPSYAGVSVLQFDHYFFTLSQPAASTALVTLDLPYGYGIIAGTYTITATNTWEDTGIEVTLPTAGTYFLAYTISGQTQTTDIGGAYLRGRLYDVTNATDVSGTYTYFAQAAWAQVGSWDGTGTTHSACTYTVAGSATVRIEAMRTGASAWNTSNIHSDPVTRLTYIRIG